MAENEDVSGWVPMAKVITLDRAIEYYTGKIRSHPENDMAYINRGHIWAKRGDYDQAIADYTEAIQIDRREDLGTRAVATPGSSKVTSTRRSPTSTRRYRSVPGSL